MKLPVTVDPRFHEAAIFDLDGVVTDTASLHARAWRDTFDGFLARRPAQPGEDHAPFTDADYRHLVDGKPRLAGIADFLAARGISLPEGTPSDHGDDTMWGVADQKQELFRKLLCGAVPVFDSTVALVRQLQGAGVKTALYSSSRNCERILAAAGLDDLFEVRVDGVVAAELGLAGKPDPAVLVEAVRRLGARCERSVVFEDAQAGVAAGRSGGFSLVIGVDRAGDGSELRACGADVVVSDLVEVAVRTGDSPMSQIPNALLSYGQLLGTVGARRPVVLLDFDGTLSDIVPDPDTAVPVEGATEALARAAAECPVAILSGRDLADVRARVNVPGIWYAGSHGFELVGPDGSFHQNEEAAAAVPVLERAAEALRGALSGVAGIRVEHKRFAVAIHYRDVAPEHVGQVVAAAHRLGQRENLRVTGGRMVVELRPNVDWDKGRTLSFICGQVAGEQNVLPIYIGDDLTDEDAFDAVRFNGIGVLVRHGDDGDRPSSAQFTLENPLEVTKLLRRGAGWLAHQRKTAADTWTISFDGYDPRDEKLREALCTVGNGYFATRGAAAESRAGEKHYPGTYVAGIYNRLTDNISGNHVVNESLVNLPNWTRTTFRVNGGAWFDIDGVTVLSLHQTLDLRTAVLSRQVRFRDGADRITSLTQRRFASMHMRHVGAQQTTVTAENWSGTVEIRSTVDGNVRNCGVARYHDLGNQHLDALETAELSDNSGLLTARTNQSRIPVAVATRSVPWRDDSPLPARYELVDANGEIGHDISVELSAGQSVTVEKMVTIFTGRDVAMCEPGADAARALTHLPRFDELRRGHEAAWAHLWERASIDFADNLNQLRIIRFHLLHLLQTVSPHASDIDAGVPARGLHGEAYRGHIFWDELFIFPVLNLRMPVITRALLQYRYRRLPEARRLARDAGYAGAMFPWQSGSDGREESQQVHLNPRSGRWNPDASARAHHIGIAVAYNVWQFYQVTGDLAYLIDFGAEMLVEIARFWASRATLDENTGRYGILGVIGPDEFHSGYPDSPHDGVDNNAYTNVMAVWVLMRALETLRLMPTPNRLDLMEKLRLTGEELARWEDVSRRMFVPFHDGVISQFERYGDLAELDWEAYRDKYGNIQRLDRILEAEGDDVNRYKASKQADALMLLYLLSSDELREVLARLGYSFAPQQIPHMVDYYMARTSHGSTLSGVVHSWVLARANRDRAIDFFHQVLRADLADIQGGTTAEGIHLAAMAGSIDLVQRCFTGLETRGDRIVLSPLWPEKLGPLGFPIHYRGLHLYLRVSGKGAEISVDPRDVPSAHIECRGVVKELVPGSTVRFPG